MGILAIDAVGIKSGGGARTVVDFLGAIRSAKGVDKIWIFTSPRSRRNFEIPDCPGFVVEERQAEDRVLSRRLWWYLYGLDRRCEAAKADVLLAMNGMGSCARNPVVAFVMQSLPYWKEALAILPLGDRLRMMTIGWLTRRSCRKASAVYTQSIWMTEHLSDCFGLCRASVRLAAPGTPPFPPGESPELLAKIATVPPEKRVLFVGSDALHKNLDVLVAGVQIVRRMIPGVTLFATISGMSRYVDREGVVALGELDRRALRVAYENCAVTVQASLVECAGLVPAEAMICGCPVVVPDRPWAREMCGSDALYFDASDAVGFAQQLSRVLTDNSLRTRMIEATRRIRKTPDASSGYAELVTHLIALANGSKQ